MPGPAAALDDCVFAGHGSRALYAGGDHHDSRVCYPPSTVLAQSVSATSHGILNPSERSGYRCAGGLPQGMPSPGPGSLQSAADFSHWDCIFACGRRLGAIMFRPRYPLSVGGRGCLSRGRVRLLLLEPRGLGSEIKSL